MSQKTDIAEGTVVITQHQTAGRGQRGNRWESERGKNLTFSLLLQPRIKTVEQFGLTMMVSLAIRDYLLSKTQSECKIKWPNDILLNQKKVCGILIENTLTSQLIERTVVGIGLNVNQKTFTLPTATSLGLVTGNQYTLNDEFHQLLSFLEARYLQLKGGHLVSLRQEYHSHLFGRGKKSLFRSAGKTFEAVIEGVDEWGKLMLLASNQINLYQFKEVEFLGIHNELK